jgi:hypothetical protein
MLVGYMQEINLLIGLLIITGILLKSAKWLEGNGKFTYFSHISWQKGGNVDPNLLNKLMETTTGC